VATVSATTTDLVRRRVTAGVPVGDARGLEPRVARAVRLADMLGASVLDALDAAARAAEDDARARRAVRVASAQTRVVAAGLVAAPVLLVPALGRIVGADLVLFYTSSRGRGVLALGVGLLAVGAVSIAALVRRVSHAGRARPGPRRGAGPTMALAGATVTAFVLAGPLAALPLALVGSRVVRGRVAAGEPHDIDEAIDLVATALMGSVAAPEALRLVADALPTCAGPLRRLALEVELGAPGGDQVVDAGAVARLRGVLATAQDVGASPSRALVALAADLRAERLADTLAAAERLPAQLTFPTTLLLLPATVLLVGAPIVDVGLRAAVW
jgi:Flp pilus assembly protein TadB